MKPLVWRLSLAPLLLASASVAAQTTAADDALGGPEIPGVCLLSREAVFANAEVGKSATAQINALAEQSQSEINAERTSLETELRSLEGQQDPSRAQQLAEQRQSLARRWETLQRLAAQRSREIEATRQKAVGRISAEAQPVVAAVYTRRGCGLLLDRGVVLGGNLGGDLTADVVRGLDAKIKTISIQREVLPSEPAVGAGEPPR
ncbi:OmpH family outer membrane protein [Luteimonas sp. R10]|uniref:OmpH family outer membrane protein n=1 Tax=Luteimonas sp. R10 TaxID=3108176 RepID=UPI003088BEAB|nr:OmpH family outer membrane protein [Luteimonas sp. R10]